MENIHVLDNDTIESLKNMLNSTDNSSVKMALTILNNADFTDSKIIECVNELNNECTGLHFALFQNKKGNIRARFHYIYFYLNRPFMIDDDSTLDNDEWEPYEPYSDLNKDFKFNYK